ncbi:MAG: metallophosphoesterase [Caldilineaceae bacterium]|jgi:hypothetical protein
MLQSQPMRVLAISDQVEPVLYSAAITRRVGDVDFVVSCGDLPFYYIEYVVSMVNKPSYYVFGNHGREVEYQGGDWRQKTEPMGAMNLHERTAKEGDLLLAGLEGSIRYNYSSRFQYTESEMMLKVIGMAPKLMRNRIRYGRYLDVLVAHSPPLGIHDQPDPAHVGFRSFLTFMRWYKPRYLLHGHVHLYRQDVVTRTMFEQTEVINVYPFQILNLVPQLTGTVSESRA